MKDDSPFVGQTRRFWDAFYINDRVAEFRRRLYLAAYGEQHPAETGTDGYITLSELRVMADALHVGPGQKIVDLGCGRGGPGRWIAQATGAALVGIDISDVALDQAREQARQLGTSDRVSYGIGSFDSTGFDPATFDAAISVDVIWAIPDKRAGFAETARILKLGARFVLTDWERDLSPPGYPPPFSDHRAVLEAVGFEVELHQVLTDAEAARRRFYKEMIAREEELIRDLGEQAAQLRLREGRAWLGLVDGVEYLKHSRRVLVAARKARGE
jgi:ubiquinone/menaquinone biosynthesis C-methylase UbiE